MTLRPEEISLYMPARNCARTLAAAIESVRAQTLRPAHAFIVLDERSCDETAAVAAQSGWEIVRQEGGALGAARNQALQRCRTPWLASCDSDVTLAPDWLEQLARRATGDVAAVGGGTNERVVTPADGWRAVSMPHNWGPLPFDQPFMLVSEMLANVAAFRAVGGYRPDLAYYEDSDCCQRLRQAGFVLRYEPGAVAWHDRRDSVQSVLDLRWVYAAHRQRAKLETLAGLRQKLAVNRTYAVQSLGQTWASEHVATAAISVALWFHHAVRDLRCALEKWPLLDERARAGCEARLLAALEHGAQECAAWLMPALSALLPRTFGERGADVAPDGLSATDGFDAYLHDVMDATSALLAAVPDEMLAYAQRSAEWLAGSTERPGAPARPELSVADRRRIESRPLSRAWAADDLRRWGVAGDPACTRVVGRVTDGEAPPVPRRLTSGDDRMSNQTLLLPHLEACPAPRSALRDALRGADVAVVAYQTPDWLAAGGEMLSARDLAAAVAAEGLALAVFEAEAGRTRIVARREASGGGVSKSQTRPVHRSATKTAPAMFAGGR